MHRSKNYTGCLSDTSKAGNGVGVFPFMAGSGSLYCGFIEIILKNQDDCLHIYNNLHTLSQMLPVNISMTPILFNVLPKSLENTLKICIN